MERKGRARGNKTVEGKNIKRRRKEFTRGKQNMVG